METKKLGFTENCIVEIILVTKNEYNNYNAAPMGIIRVNNMFEVKPFMSSKTYRNLHRTKHASINITNDPMIFYKTAFKNQSEDTLQINDWIIEDSNASIMVEKKGDIRLKHFDKLNKQNIKPIITDNIASDATIHTDESSIYKFLPKAKRKIVNHTLKEYVGKNGVTTNTIEGSFAHFKKTINAIYHFASKKHIQKYADMFSFRWNTRDYSSQDRINEFLEMISGKRLQYKDLIGK